MPLTPTISMQTQLENGLDLENLAGSAYRVYWLAQDLEPMQNWQGLSEEDAQRWGRVVKAAYVRVIAEDAVSAAWLAWQLMQASRGEEMPQQDFTNLDAAARFVWEAVGRHLALVIDTERVDNLPGLEAQAAEWARKKRTNHGT